MRWKKQASRFAFSAHLWKFNDTNLKLLNGINDSMLLLKLIKYTGDQRLTQFESGRMGNLSDAAGRVIDIALKSVSNVRITGNIILAASLKS